MEDSTKDLEYAFFHDSQLFQQTLENCQTSETITLLEKLLKEEKFHTEDGKGSYGFLRAIFKLLSPDTERGAEQRAAILSAVIKWISTKGNDTSCAFDKGVTDIINQCINEINNLSEKALIDTTNLIFATLHRKTPLYGKFFSFIPPILALYESCGIVTIKESIDNVREFTGPEYKDYLLMRILRLEWNKDTILSIVTMLQDISNIDSIELDEIPPIIYQLLLISRKGHKRVVINGIAEYFNKLDQIFEEIKGSEQKEKEPEVSSLSSFMNLSLIEGTVIIHITFAVKQDQELGAEYIKYVKSGKTMYLTPFNIACLLSIARIHRFEDTVLDLLKNMIKNHFKDREKLENKIWMSKLFPSHDGVSLSNIFQHIIRKTSFGWDQVTQCLAQLAFVLLDAAVSPLSSGKIGGRKAGSHMTANDLMTELAIQILLEMFKIHDMIRTEILNQILSRVVSKSSSIGNFLVLLEIIVKEAPDALMDYLSKIKEAFDYLSYLSVDTADLLLKAVQPIILLDQSFRDGLMLVLRKSMFAKNIEGRQIALKGFIQMLMISTQEENDDSVILSDDLTSDSMQVQESKALKLEILGILRRIFHQQADIRLVLYDGLMRVMDVSENLNPDIFEILYTQTSLHPNLRLDLCIENVAGELCAVEPLGNLIQCISRSVTIFSRNCNDDGMSVEANHMLKFKNDLSLLIERICSDDVINYHVDPAAEGARSNIACSLLIGCFEALIEYVFFSKPHSSESSSTILKIFQKYTDLVKEKTTSNPKGRKSTINIGDNSILSFRFIGEICKFTFCDCEENESNTAKTILRSDPEFVKYITTVTYAKIKQIPINNEPHNSSMFSYCTSLAQVFMNEFINNLNNNSNQNLEKVNKKTKSKSILSIAIESFHHLTQTVSNCWPEKLSEYLSIAYPSNVSLENTPTDLDSWLGLYIREFERLVTSLMKQSPPLISETTGLCEIISLLSKYFTKDTNDDDTIPAQQQNLEQLISWLREFCIETYVDDVGLTKSAVGLLINLEKNMTNFESVAEMSHDAFLVLGDINTSICGIIVSFLEQMYQDLEGCIERMKSMCSFEDAESDSSSEHTKIEAKILTMMIKLINISINLVRTDLPETSSEHLIKSLQRTYKALLALTKYKISEAGPINQLFIGVIELAGSNLSESLYNHLTFSLQSTGMRRQGMVKKGKGTTNSNMARVIRESKLIPSLIFLIESFERYLLQLSKKSKTELMQYIKRATARDFKLQIDNNQQKHDDEGESSATKKRTKKATTKRKHMEEIGEQSNQKEDHGQDNDDNAGEGGSQEHNSLSGNLFLRE
ncbi:9995_t:CDS:10 [Ambispora gerdemannii]|uniref:9995_t:CDS:1 n=1 Tax=Ambispora gerdemannii TaxID=144530 RepID=A0A9N8V1F1_9GLOM|nr:9995_t:CDS:10 [Ambispora gerdemannii]